MVRSNVHLHIGGKEAGFRNADRGREGGGGETGTDSLTNRRSPSNELVGNRDFPSMGFGGVCRTIDDHPSPDVKEGQGGMMVPGH